MWSYQVSPPREAFPVTLPDPVEKEKVSLHFPSADESSSISHMCSALKVVHGQIGAHSAEWFCCWAITGDLIKLSHRQEKKVHNLHNLWSLDSFAKHHFPKNGDCSTSPGDKNPKMEFVIVYNVCRDTEPQNQRGSEAKIRGMGRRSTPYTMTLKSKCAPDNWLERMIISISEFVKLFSSQGKGNICSTRLTQFWVSVSPCVLL